MATPKHTPWLRNRCQICVAYDALNKAQNSSSVPMRSVIRVPRCLIEVATSGALRRAWDIERPPIKAYSRCEAPLNVEWER